MMTENLCGEVFIADTFITRLKGYMFQEKPKHECILIKPCSSIHTYFMKFNIDVLFLDENMMVIKKINGLLPGLIVKPVSGCKMVMEAKEGTFSEVSIGDVVNIEDF